MVWMILAAGLCTVDLVIKHWIDKHKEVNSHKELMGGKIIITKFYNEGAFMGAMKNHARHLLGITLVGLGIIIGFLIMLTGKRGNVLLKLGLSLMLGGAASNAYDRLMHGKVTDYFRISIGSKRLERFIFNIGDMCIFAGSILALISNMKNKG